MRVLAISDMHWNIRSWVESAGQAMGLPALTLFPRQMVDRGHEYYWLVLDSARLKWEKHDFEAAASDHYDYSSSRILPPMVSGHQTYTINGIHMHIASLPAQWLYNKLLLRSALRHIKLYGVLYTLFGVRLALNLARGIQPDIVYGQSPFVSATVARILGVPCALRLYGTFLYPYLFPWYRRLPKLGQFLVFRLPVAAFIITNDGTRGDEVAAAMGVPADKVYFWMNGVNKQWAERATSKEEARRRLGMESEVPIVLAVSRLEAWKRIDRAISALPSIVSCFPNARLVIVGDGAQRVALEILARNLGVQENVQFVGPVPHDQVFLYMRAADLIISLYELSNLCNPVLEAMICGRCVISLADGSLEHVIDPGKTGILLAPDHVEQELPKTIIELLKQPERIWEIGHQAQEYARRHFWSWDERIEQECELLETLVQSFCNTSA